MIYSSKVKQKPIFLLMTAGCIVLFFFFGCSRPPRSMSTVNILDYSATTLSEVQHFSGDIEGFRNYYKEKRDNHNVFEFLEGTRVEVESTYGGYVKETVLRSLPDNGLVLERPLYVTEGEKNEALVSTDKNVWYSTKTDFERGIDNFRNRYDFRLDYRPGARYLNVLYDLCVAFNETMEKRYIREHRREKVLEKGMVFKHNNPFRVNYDLKDKIVYLPKGTVIHTHFALAGNLIRSEKKDGAIVVDVLQDFYFYQKGLRFGFSFDNKDWRHSILSFKIAPLLEVYADRDDHVFVTFGLYIEHRDLD